MECCFTPCGGGGAVGAVNSSVAQGLVLGSLFVQHFVSTFYNHQILKPTRAILILPWQQYTSDLHLHYYELIFIIICLPLMS